MTMKNNNNNNNLKIIKITLFIIYFLAQKQKYGITWDNAGW